MLGLFKVTTSPMPTVVERFSEAVEAHVGSSDHVDGVQGASLVIETSIVEVDNPGDACGAFCH